MADDYGEERSVPRTISALLLAAALALAGCGSDRETGADPDQTSESSGQEGDMSDGVDEMLRQAAEALGVSADSVETDGPRPIEGSSCVLYSAWDRQSTDPFSREYAVLTDGSVVGGLTEDAARRVLDHCFFDLGVEPGPDTVADIVVRMAEAPGPVGLLDEELGPRRLEPLGLEYRPPTASGSVEAGDFAVSFFARDFETGDILQATVNRRSDGTIDVAYQDL